MLENEEFSFSEEKITPEKKTKWPKTVIIVLSVLMAILIVFAIVAVVFVKTNFNYKYNKLTKNPTDLGFQEVIEEKNINIALFGIDTREENSFSGRSDSIMIMNVNTETNKIKLISVMRDSFVPIDDGNKQKITKINSAYATGGPELAIKTLNTIFGLDISEYATVNFEGMADIIDAVGGIDVELTQEELRSINGMAYEQAKKYGGEKDDYMLYDGGKTHLNGLQAVAYSRIRYVANAQGTSNDYGRTDRQRYVLNQLFNKAKTIKKSEYMGLIKKLLPCCETSLSYGEILNISLSVLLESPTLEETRIPSTDYIMQAPKTNAGSVVYYDLNFAARLIHSFIYDDIKPEDYIAANGIQKNDWYTQGYNPPIFEKR